MRLSGSTSGLCGSFVVISSNICTVWNRRPGDVGLYFRIGMICYAPSKNSGIFSPSRSFTYAFFQSDRWPAKRPWRLILPCEIAVRTLSTFDPEQLLDRALDVDLRRARGHFEHERATVLAQERCLLGDERPADDVCLFHASDASSFCKASRVAITRSVSMTSRAVTRALGLSVTPAMFRAVSANPSS